MTNIKTSPRQRLLFNSDWRFQKTDSSPDDISYAQISFDDGDWRALNLPHDWGIEGPFKQEYPGETGKLAWWGVGWYRKHFTVAASDGNIQYSLEIDGAMSNSQVWLNGQLVGGWPYGYSSFSLDLTPHIKRGEKNVLAIRLDNAPHSSRWYPGGGIYRNVWLTQTAPIHVVHWGTKVTTPEVRGSFATIDIQVEIENRTASDAVIALHTDVYELGANGEKSGAPVASSVSGDVSIAAGASTTKGAQLSLSNPRLWSPESPQRYVAVTTLERENEIVDSHATIFGIRNIHLDADKGFFLNERRVQLNGVCLHHDLGPLGAAINARALERQIELLQEMGCNAIRTSHNPPAPELLELCDRMGMLVIDEAFDCWRQAKKPNDYGRFFEDWHEKDLRAMVRRDRNHPCVIAWSIGNEIPEQWKPEGVSLSAKLARILREEDLTRPVTVGVNVIEAGYNGFEKAVDFFGFNYKPFEYPTFHAQNPDIALYGSETASAVSSRGEYYFPVSEDKNEGRANFQVSSYDLYAPPWATTPDEEFAAQDKSAFVAGEFVWTGFDYLGEPTPYNDDSTNLLNFSDAAQREKMERDLAQLGKIEVPSRSSYFGILDLCGFKKDRFYIYQTKWRPDFPMAHILPHWNWPERIGEITPVHVYTSGDDAELFLNGHSLGRKKKAQYEYRLRWDDVKYEAGELRVIAYKNGAQWAENTIKTTGSASSIALRPDCEIIKSDGRDLSFVTVSITDKDGATVPRSHSRVRFEVSGPGEIVAVDNGDATRHESFQSQECDAFNGLCLVIIRSIKGETGQITLTARSDGLEESTVVVQSVA